MDLKYLFFISIILVASGFDFIKPDIESSPEDRIIQFHAKFLLLDSAGVATFECENFAADALNNYTIATINRKFRRILNCVKEPVVNKHDAAFTDTIYTFSNRENKIQIYRATQNDFIFTFDVTDAQFKLAGNIRPGITKDVFSRKFHITEIINNKVQIVNTEGTMRFMFYFENHILKRINSYLYLD